MGKDTTVVDIASHSSSREPLLASAPRHPGSPAPSPPPLTASPTEHLAGIRDSLDNMKNSKAAAPATASAATITKVGARAHASVSDMAKAAHRKFHEIGESRQPWRKTLGSSLEAKEVHILIISLLVIDLIAVVFDVLETIRSKADDVGQCLELLSLCHESAKACDAFKPSTHSDFSFYVSMFILCALLLNVVLLLVSWGLAFFLHPGYIMDFIVVITAIILETAFDDDAAGLLAVLTAWRLVRVMHGIFEVTDETFHQEIEKIEERVKHLEDIHHKDQEEIQQLKGRP